MVPQSARLTSLIAAAALALGGCAATPFGPSGPAPLPPPQRSGESAAGAASPSAPRDASPAGMGRQTNQAAAALLTESRAASEAGDHAAAAVTLERALAIDPNDALLWIELAEVRWRQGDREQAESLARKALTIAGDDGLVIDRAERLIGRR